MGLNPKEFWLPLLHSKFYHSTKKFLRIWFEINEKYISMCDDADRENVLFLVTNISLQIIYWLEQFGDWHLKHSKDYIEYV